jgi:uncharacterized RDD family membrane protein YckC
MTDQPESAAVQAAPFVRRAAAFLIDLALINVLGLFLALAALYGMALGLWQEGQSLPSRNLIFSLAEYGAASWPLLMTGYFGYFTAGGGQTPGKMALRIMVVTAQNGPVGLWQGWWRAVIITASLPVFAVYLIAALTPQKRALHDYLAGTRVIMLPTPLRPHTEASEEEAAQAAVHSAVPP